MINSLHIKNYLLIPEVLIEFDQGLTVITGETGAGKSLIVDSLKFIFGAKTDTRIVRENCELAEITAKFSVNNLQTLQLLETHNLHAGTECVVRREIFRFKPTRTYVNNKPASLQVLRELGSTLVDIHGQHEHHTLLRASTQRRILDGYVGNAEDVREIENCSRLIHSIRTKISEAETRKSDYRQHLEFLRDQSRQLVDLNPEEGEFTSLKEKLIQLTHAEELTASLGQISMGLFYSDESTISGTLGEYSRRLERLGDFDGSIQPKAELLEEAKFQIDEIARELRSHADRIEYDPEQIALIEDRMAALQRLARAHNTDADELPSVLNELNSKIENYENELGNIESLDSFLEGHQKNYDEIASRISDRRKLTSPRFGEIITGQMQNLGMEGGVFSVELTDPESEQYASYGTEDAKFMVSTNPGQPMGALSEVASGGELSRLSLALQVTSLDIAKVPTIVFDEVDVGIGGRVAERVGKLLQSLGNSVQIICITHLPQVAAQGHHQMNVEKITEDTSIVEVNLLDQNQRINEIARMLGGAKITDRTIEHAKEMLFQGIS